jgi:hypothetical protein
VELDLIKNSLEELGIAGIAIVAVIYAFYLFRSIMRDLIKLTSKSEDNNTRLAVSMDKLGDAIKELSGVIVSTVIEQKELKTRLDSWLDASKKNSDSLLGRVSKLGNDLTGIKMDVQSISPALQGMEKRMSEKNDTLQKQIGEIRTLIVEILAIARAQPQIEEKHYTTIINELNSIKELLSEESKNDEDTQQVSYTTQKDTSTDSAISGG